VVAAGHRCSARAGAEALARGGNAVDAACAAAFAAAVAESPLTGPGAGGFLLARTPDGCTTLLDFFVAVPGLGPGGRPLDPGDLISFTVPFGGAEQVFHIGPASVAVPGMLPGLGEAAARLGRLPLAELVAPAAALARAGVVMTREAEYLHLILHGMLAATPEAAAIYEPEGRPLRAGERLRLPDLAATLEHLGRHGADAMCGGELGRAIVSHLRATGGLVTDEDLAAYAVVDRTPLEVSYRDVVLLTNSPPSSGGVLIVAALRALDAGSEHPAGDALTHDVAVARAGRAANALRDAAFAEAVREEGFLERFLAGGGRAPEPSRKLIGSTTHISAVDREGGMASMSSSNGAGSGVVVPGTGILLNNMLGEAGSNRLRSAILQTVTNIVDLGMDLPAAVARPRVHPEGDGADVEGGIGEEVAAALAADGHALRRWGAMNLFFGGVAVAGRGPSGLSGAGDPRRGGAAAGVTRAGQVVDL
jgi:gamma-glutamyltranspeptidase / glutathione hydrolase